MASTATKQRMVRMSMYLKKRKDLTEDEFNRHWSEVHGPLVRPLLEKYGCIQYTQYHTSSAVQDASTVAWPGLKDMKRTEYDGVAEFLVPNVLCLQKAREDPYFIEKVAPDEENFFDTQNANWTVGWEEVYVKDGKVVSD